MKNNTMPPSITRNEVAALLQITPQRVSQLAAAGVFQRTPDGRKYLTAGFVGAYADFRADAIAKRQHQDGMAGIKQKQLERLEAQISREDAGLITMTEALEFGEAMIGKFLDAYRSIPGRLEEGSKLRKGLQSAIPGYAAELEKQLRQPLKELKGGENYTL